MLILHQQKRSEFHPTSNQKNIPTYTVSAENVPNSKGPQVLFSAQCQPGGDERRARGTGW